MRKAAFQAGRERLLSSDGALDCLLDGRPDGEFLSSARIDRVSASMGPLPGHDVMSSRRYRGGEAQGPLLTISEAVEPDGTLSILTTEVGTAMAPRTELSRTYIGSQLQMESTLVEGVLHGWMRIYDVRLIKDYPSPAKEPQQLCYQHGRQAPESACAAVS